MTPLELLDRLSNLITPPRVHKHRYCGVLAPNARLRRAVIASAGPAGATLQILQDARERMGLGEAASPAAEPPSRFARAAAKCWALLLTRIYECLPLRCPNCGDPMRIIAFILDPPVIERILRHVGESPTPPEVSPARAPPQAELEFDQAAGLEPWPGMDQTGGGDGDSWN